MLPLSDSREALEAARRRLTQALVELDRRRLQAVSDAVRQDGGGVPVKPAGEIRPSPERVEKGRDAQSLADRLRAWFVAARQ